MTGEGVENALVFSPGVRDGKHYGLGSILTVKNRQPIMSDGSGLWENCCEPVHTFAQRWRKPGKFPVTLHAGEPSDGSSESFLCKLTPDVQDSEQCWSCLVIYIFLSSSKGLFGEPPQSFASLNSSSPRLLYTASLYHPVNEAFLFCIRYLLIHHTCLCVSVVPPGICQVWVFFFFCNAFHLFRTCVWHRRWQICFQNRG